MNINKFFLLNCIGFPLLLMASCSNHVASLQSAPNVHSFDRSLDWEGSYQGLVPCASCPGINTWLQLEEDGAKVTYILTENYLEENEGFFQSKGRGIWNKNESILQLDDNGETKFVFLAEDAAYFLPKEAKSPGENSLYKLNKLSVFTGKGEKFFVNINNVNTVVAEEKSTTLYISDGVINFDDMSRNAYQSLQADFEISCEDRLYKIPIATYYEKPFAGGKVIERVIENEKKYYNFEKGMGSVVQIADEFCQ